MNKVQKVWNDQRNMGGGGGRNKPREDLKINIEGSNQCKQ